MPNIPPVAFNIAFGTTDKLGADQLDELLPAIARDLRRATSPDQVRAYLAERAVDLRDLGGGNSRVKRMAGQLDTLAESATIDADLFAGMVAFAYGGGTRILPDEAEALGELKDWVLDNTKPADKKATARKMLAELEVVAYKPASGEGIATGVAQERVDTLVAELRQLVAATQEVSNDKGIDPAAVRKDVAQYEVNTAMHSLIRIAPRGVGKRGVIDHDKVEWFRKRIQQDGEEKVVPVGMSVMTVRTPALASEHPNERVDLISRHIDTIAEYANFFEGASLGYSIFEISPASIPSESVRLAASAVARAINEKRAAEDGTRLSCFELETALAALNDGGDAGTRARLLQSYREVAGVAIDGPHEQTAIDALRAYLGVIDDFMKDDENVLLCAGFTAFEVGHWKPKRAPETVVATYFPLPNEKGELDYEINSTAEGEKIHAAYADDLAQTGLNCVTFEFDGRVWVAVYPTGDLESMEPGRTEVPVFDVERQARGSGKVIGKVDPLTSSAGEAVFRTGSRFLKSFVGKLAGTVGDAEKRGAKLAEAAEKHDSKVIEKFSLIGLIGVGGAAAISPAFLWGLLGLAGAPSAVNLAGFAVSSLQLRPIYELLGNTVIRSKKL